MNVELPPAIVKKAVLLRKMQMIVFRFNLKIDWSVDACPEEVAIRACAHRVGAIFVIDTPLSVVSLDHNANGSRSRPQRRAIDSVLYYGDISHYYRINHHFFNSTI